MSSQFTIKYTGDKASLLNKLRGSIGDNGQLNGNEKQGDFEGSTPLGSFEGRYNIEGDDIIVTIDKKPFLVSNGRIQEEFEKALKKA